MKKKKLASLGGEHQSATSSILGMRVGKKDSTLYNGELSPDQSFHTTAPAHENIKVYLQPVNNLRKQGVNEMSNTSSFVS
jgi:hypothetical protein